MNTVPISNRRVATDLTRLRRVNARLAWRIRRLTRDVSQARHLATHDSLTGLPNRRLLLDRLGQALAYATRYRQRVVLLVIDLDGFKLVNDVHGHGVGDELLRQVAGRLQNCVRLCDTVCRYGGDEFVVMLPQIGAAEDAEVVSAKIRARLAAPYAFGNEQPIRVTVSIGVAVYLEDGQTSRELLDRADAAMYAEKIRHKPYATDNPQSSLSLVHRDRVGSVHRVVGER
jgi:diguanylate cyclase (GGDEF)-like protein